MARTPEPLPDPTMEGRWTDVADAASALRAMRTDPNRPVYRPGLRERVRGWFTRGE